MNIIFRRCLNMLKLTEIRRDFYDPQNAEDIPVCTSFLIFIKFFFKLHNNFFFKLRDKNKFKFEKVSD